MKVDCKLKAKRREKRLRIRVKVIKDCLPIPDIKCYSLDRRDYEIPESARGNGFLQCLWSLRRDFIMKWNYYPSYLIIHCEDAYKHLYDQMYNSFKGSGAILPTCNGNAAHRVEVFGLKVIETGNVKQDEFFLA